MRRILEEGGEFDDSPEYLETRYDQALLDSEITRLDTIVYTSQQQMGDVQFLVKAVR